MATTAQSVADICAAARRAAPAIARLDSGTRDAALLAIAAGVQERADEILEANARDTEAAEASGEYTAAFLDKLKLNPERVAQIAEGARQIVALADPVGETIEGWPRRAQGARAARSGGRGV